MLQGNIFTKQRKLDLRALFYLMPDVWQTKGVQSRASKQDCMIWQMEEDQEMENVLLNKGVRSNKVPKEPNKRITK